VSSRHGARRWLATTEPLALRLSIRTIYGIAASYFIARLAPDRPMQHALVGGFLGLVVGIVGAVVTWNKGPAFGPHWYPLALIVLAMPQAWAGGQLSVMQLRAHQQHDGQTDTGEQR
jgi:hypothetical protein